MQQRRTGSEGIHLPARFDAAVGGGRRNHVATTNIPVDQAGEVVVLRLRIGPGIELALQVFRPRNDPAAARPIFHDEAEGRGARKQPVGVGGAAFVPAVELPDKRDRKVRSGFQREASTHAIAVLLAIHLPVGAENEAVMAIAPARDAQRSLLTQRHIGHAINVEFVVGPVLDIDRAFVDADLRLAVHDTDQAGGGVLAEQHALRSLQDLDPLHVDHVGDAAADARKWHAIYRNPDRGLECRRQGVSPHAANIEAVELCLTGWIERQARDQLRKVCRADYSCLLQLFRLQGDDRHRDVLDALRSLVRRHHDDRYASVIDLRRIVGRCFRRVPIAGLGQCRR